MFNHIYGSPFPTINPKVRYRTALERAGFDVNFNSRSAANGDGLGSADMNRRNVSMGNLQQPPPRSQSRAASRVASLPGVREQPGEYHVPLVHKPYAPSAKYSTGSQARSSGPSRAQSSTSSQPSGPTTAQYSTSSQPSGPSTAQYSTSSQPSGPSTAQYSTSSQPSGPTNTSGSYSANPSLQYSSASKPSFTFEERPSHHQERELNPIERSFMMLTQNDTSSSVDIRTTEMEIKEPVEEQPVEEQPAEIHSPTTPRKSVHSTVESLNFEPSSELHVGLSPVNHEKETPKVIAGKQLPVLSVTTHLDSQWSQSDKKISEKERGSVTPEDLTTPHTATNLQVETLIAQLDNVSYSKNAQLDNPFSTSTATNSLSGSQLDVRSLSVDRTRSHSNTSSQFKKSSAYLSKLPEADLETGAQTVTLDQESVSSPSLKMGDTPTFYKFRQPRLNSFPGPEETPIPSIEPLQLSRKDKIEGSPRIEPAQEESTIKNDVPSNSGNETLNIESEPKYPPGEGPCRNCGQEVVDRPIYSKKANELSGQWHRQCFRCLNCDVKFNKTTPCYILDDKPYCQQHYHEENGSICQVCSGFIEGECLENDRTERFHVHCLTCFLCHTQITSDYFIYNLELPLCGNHDLEALLQEGPDSSVSKRRTRLINFTQS